MSLCNIVLAACACVRVCVYTAVCVGGFGQLVCCVVLLCICGPKGVQAGAGRDRGRGLHRFMNEIRHHSNHWGSAKSKNFISRIRELTD